VSAKSRTLIGGVVKPISFAKIPVIRSMMIDPKKLDYRNVTISGLPGTGTTTLMRLLAKKLAWDGYSGGEFMRAYALEKGLFKPEHGEHHFATDYEDEFDRKIDLGVREKLEKKSGGIYEAWLTGFMAQGIEGVLKVLLVCSDDAIRVDRVVNRDHVTVAQAKDHILTREEQNRRKWTRMYRDEWFAWVVKPGVVNEEEPIDFWDPRIYDLIIDTYSNSREETLRKVLDKVGYFRAVTP
jgi:cytidylate kinase